MSDHLTALLAAGEFSPDRHLIVRTVDEREVWLWGWSRTEAGDLVGTHRSSRPDEDRRTVIAASSVVSLSQQPQRKPPSPVGLVAFLLAGLLGLVMLVVIAVRAEDKRPDEIDRIVRSLGVTAGKIDQPPGNPGS